MYPFHVHFGSFICRFKEPDEVDTPPEASTARQLTVTEELNEYVEMTLDKDDKRDSLKFWAKVRRRLPVLAEVAAMMLNIPATSAGSERTFSAAGAVITEKRSMLKPKVVDSIVCLNSFTKQEFC